MKLVSLRIKNFMPYKERTSLDFPQEESQNVVLVFGDNMRGKTSLLNAIRWGFYGKALGRHSRQIQLIDLINKDAAAEDDWRMEVFIEFVSGGDAFELRRICDRRSPVIRPSRNEDLQVSVFLKKNGSIVSGDQIDYEIDQVAPEQTSRFFLFDGELLQEYEELLFEGSEQGRQIKEAIEQVLGVPTLVRGRDQLGAILSSASKVQAKSVAHIQGLKAAALKTEKLNEQLEILKEDLARVEHLLAKHKDERQNLEDHLEAAASILAMKVSLDAARQARSEGLDLISRKNLERHDVLRNAWKDMLEAMLSTKRRLLQAHQRQITTEMRSAFRFEADLDRLRDLVNTDSCPTCEQSVTLAAKEEFRRRLGEMQAKVAAQLDVTNQLNSISAQLGVLDKIRGTNAAVRLAQVDRDLKLAQIKVQKAENDIADIEEKVDEQDATELARKRARVTDLLREEGKLISDLEAIQGSIKKVKEELAIARKAIEGVASARAEKSTHKVSLVASLERVFSSSIEVLRDRLRGKVEDLASNAFRQMTTQGAYQGLKINANYGLSILDSHGRTVSLRSAGAEQIVALSLIDGLNRTGRAAGPVIMDTPFGRLDPKHRANILQYLPNVTTQFVLFVHAGEIRKETDLDTVKHRIGRVYELVEVSESQTKLERSKL